MHGIINQHTLKTKIRRRKKWVLRILTMDVTIMIFFSLLPYPPRTFWHDGETNYNNYRWNEPNA